MRGVVLLLFVAFVGSVYPEDAPVVTVAQGELRGKVLKSFGGRDFLAYQGIPYAKPPIGELRFRAPAPSKPWDGIKDATEEGPVCPQWNMLKNVYEGEEDCLFMNVYKPKNPGVQSPLDVMVWIHGGGFAMGTGNTNMQGPDYLMDKDIVFVSFNYRLGALGFLSTEDEVLPGNNGLKDQTLALKWVKENIAAFGGNPDSITIFGESAGGASVHFHILSPLSKGLFHRAISQSGTTLCSWGIAPEARSIAFKLGDVLNCKAENSKDLVDCLRKHDPKLFTVSVPALKEWGSDFYFPFVAVVEKASHGDEPVFLSEHPLEILQKGKFNKVPWVTGVTSHEGMLTAAMFLTNPQLVQDVNNKFETVVPIYQAYERNTEKSKEISRKIRNFYFGEKEISAESINEFIQMDSDSFFVAPATAAAKLHLANGSPVYFYVLTAQGQYSFGKIFLGAACPSGVSHGDDLLYMFPVGDISTQLKLTDPEVLTKDRLITMWTNFASTGNPTPEKTELLPVKWERATKDELRYLDIGQELEMKDDPHTPGVFLWESIRNYFSSGTSRDEL